MIDSKLLERMMRRYASRATGGRFATAVLASLGLGVGLAFAVHANDSAFTDISLVDQVQSRALFPIALRDCLPAACRLKATLNDSRTNIININGDVLEGDGGGI